VPAGYLLDADVFRLYVTGASATVERVVAQANLVRLSSVTVEEMVGGRLNVINRARSGKAPISVAEAHEEFAELLDDIRPFPLLIYSEEADRVFRAFPASVRRIGPQDCRCDAQPARL